MVARIVAAGVKVAKNAALAEAKLPSALEVSSKAFTSQKAVTAKALTLLTETNPYSYSQWSRSLIEGSTIYASEPKALEALDAFRGARSFVVEQAKLQGLPVNASLLDYAAHNGSVHPAKLENLLNDAATLKSLKAAQKLAINADAKASLAEVEKFAKKGAKSKDWKAAVQLRPGRAKNSLVAETRPMTPKPRPGQVPKPKPGAVVVNRLQNEFNSMPANLQQAVRELGGLSNEQANTLMQRLDEARATFDREPRWVSGNQFGDRLPRKEFELDTINPYGSSGDIPGMPVYNRSNFTQDEYLVMAAHRFGRTLSWR